MFDIKPFERKNETAVYDPFKEMDDFTRGFFGDDFFNDFFPMMAMPMRMSRPHRGNHFTSPLAEFKTDIIDNGDSYKLEADLPGFDKNDINIEFDDDLMTIKAERNFENEEKDDKTGYVRRERSFGSYSRSFDVSGIDTAKMKAEYKNGVLKLNLPKKEISSPETKRLSID